MSSSSSTSSESTDSRVFWSVYSADGESPYLVACLDRASDSDSLLFDWFTDFEPIRTLQRQLDVQRCITNARQGSQLHTLLLDLLASRLCRSVKSAVFKYDHCRSVLSQRVSFTDGSPVQSWVDLSERELVVALGSLVSWLSQDGLAMQLDGISQLPLFDDRVGCLVQRSVMRRLRIFNGRPEQAIRDRDGYCWMSILSRNAGTSLAKRKIRSWIARPSCDAGLIRRRLSMQRFVLSEQPTVHGWLEKCSSRIKGIPLSTLLGDSSFRMWSQLRVVLHSLLELLTHFRVQGVALDPLLLMSGQLKSKLDSTLVLRLQQCLDRIDGDIDWNRQSFEKGVSDELDQTEQHILRMDEYLSHLTLSEKHSQRIPSDSDVSIVYLQSLGFLLEVPEAVADQYDRSFTVSCSDNGRVYLKYHTLRQMDEQFGDIYVRRQEQIAQLSRQLFDAVVLPLSEELSLLLDWLGLMDALQSIVSVCKSHDLCEPTIRPLTKDSSQRRSIEIKGGLHLPLLLKKQGRCVGNDLHLSSEVCIVSGANSSGKSVFLEMVGSLVYLAQCGLFVPAQHCSLDLVRHIFKNDVLDEHEQLSLFSEDCCLMSQMIRHCNQDSLLIIDEFGKGTRTRDATALLTAVVEQLSKDHSPLVLVATHFLDLRSHLHCPVQPKHMQLVSDSNRQLCYTYRLRDGWVDNCYGLRAAAAIGLSRTIISRADRVRSLMLAKPKQQGLLLTPVHSDSLATKLQRLDQWFDGLAEVLRDGEMADIRHFLKHERPRSDQTTSEESKTVTSTSQE